jgi:hypothetical protein
MAIAETDALARIAALEARIEELEGRPGTAASPDSGAVEDRPMSRRRLLGMAGAAAAAGLGGAIVASAPADATTGNMQFGAANDAGSADTSLTSTTSNATLTVTDATPDAVAVRAVAGNGTGVKGTAANGAGVLGVSTSTGVGVRAGTADGYCLMIEGPTSSGVPISMSPAGAPGPPSTGAHTAGDIWMDSATALFQCTSAGIPGTWAQIPQLGRDQAVAPTTTTRLAGSVGGGNPILWATNSASGNGLTGQSPSGIGVVGDTDSGVAVRGGVNTASTGVHLELFPTSQVGPPTAGAHTLGQFYVDQDGVLFQCVEAATPGTWVRQSPLVILGSPFRVYDSRVGQANPSGSPQGKLAFGATRTINCTPALPAGITNASALLTNLTVTGTVGNSGALTMFSAAVAVPSTSSINWTTAGTNLANAVTSACDSSQDVKVKCVAKVGCSTDFIIDVIGIYP